MSTLEFKLNISQEMNGVVYTCQSANEALQRSVHEAISLNVLCKYPPPPNHLLIEQLHSAGNLLHTHTHTPITIC